MKHQPFVVVSGPSGVGKSCTIQEMLKLHPDAALAVSATTRKPRVGEEDGKDYYFISNHVFETMKENGDFLESHGVYGTPKSEIARLRQAAVLFFDLDPQGALAMKKRFPNARLVFLLPPSINDLFERLQKRDTEESTEIRRRMNLAKSYLQAADQYDMLLINRDIHQTAQYLLEWLSTPDHLQKLIDECDTVI